MNEREFVRRVVEAMESLGVRYFITGGMAAIAYGEMRFTNGLDLVAELTLANVPGMRSLFPADEYYLSEAAMRDAVARHGQFNILQPTSGNKVDVMVAAPGGYDESRMRRRRQLQLEPLWAPFFASPEDVILKKLQYYQLGGSEKHLRDIASMLLIQQDRINREYIAEWAARLNVAEEWAMIRQRVDAGQQ